MKPKTFLLFVLIVAAVICTVLFIEINGDELRHQFVFFGRSFSIMRGMVAIILISAILPSCYFSLKYFRLLTRVKELETAADDVARANKGMLEGETAYQHGHYRRALDLLPAVESKAASLLRAKCLIALGEREQALQILRRSYLAEADIESGYLMVQLQQEQGLSPEETLRNLIASNPEHAKRAFELLLAYYERNGQWSACLATAKQMQQHHHEVAPERLIAYRYEWLSEQTDETPKKLIEGYQQIIKQAPDFVPAQLALGDVHMTSGAVEKAFRVYEQAFEKSRNPVFLDRLETFYLEQDRPEDAIQVYRQLLVKVGGPLLKFQLGKLYFKLEMLDEALAILEPLETSHGKVPGYLAYRAEIKARRYRQDEALEDMKRLLVFRGFAGQDFICVNCSTPYHAWQARCDHCHQWNKIILEAALVKPEEVSTSPLYY